MVPAWQEEPQPQSQLGKLKTSMYRGLPFCADRHMCSWWTKLSNLVPFGKARKLKTELLRYALDIQRHYWYNQKQVPLVLRSKKELLSGCTIYWPTKCLLNLLHVLMCLVFKWTHICFSWLLKQWCRYRNCFRWRDGVRQLIVISLTFDLGTTSCN